MDETNVGPLPMLIGVVGPCGAGKTTLVTRLKQYGFRGKHIAQEHSYVPDMWKRMTNPDVLVYLYVSYPVTIIRRKLSWTDHEYQEQLRRLENARQHADLIIFTDDLTPDQVFAQFLEYLGDAKE